MCLNMFSFFCSCCSLKGNFNRQKTSASFFLRLKKNYPKTNSGFAKKKKIHCLEKKKKAKKNAWPNKIKIKKKNKRILRKHVSF